MSEVSGVCQLTFLRLTPHESDKTDVVLVGHSLGGILAAEVVLMPSRIPGSNELYHHRILGLMAFDVPFLGVHPSVVGTGIASLFRTPPQPPESPLAESGLFTDPSSAQQDPTYNPSYSNDVHLANRKGKLQRAWYFWNKHAGEVVNAAGKYLSSHVEFGGCLADYPGLTKRYNAVRALEEVDETVKPRSPDGRLMRRVRFVNYYSASTGHVKERPPSPGQQPAFLEPPPTVLQQSSSRPSSAQALPTPSEPNPVVSLDEYREGEIITKELAELNIDPDPPEYTPMSTTSSRSTPSSATEEVVDSIEDPSGELSLPPVPDLPERPVDFDPSQYQDEDSRTRSRREHERKLKAYERAVRDRDKAIKEREKLARKRRRDTLKQQQQAEKRAKQEGTRLHKEQSKLWAPMKPDEHDERLRHEAEATQNKAQTGKKQKDRKFCTLPAKDPKTGKPDPTWVRVYMEGIDEVVAHTSMFTVGERYAKMVGDTVDRIEGWVLDDASTRVVLEGMEAQMVKGGG